MILVFSHRTSLRKTKLTGFDDWRLSIATKLIIRRHLHLSDIGLSRLEHRLHSIVTTSLIHLLYPLLTNVGLLTNCRLQYFTVMLLSVSANIGWRSSNITPILGFHHQPFLSKLKMTWLNDRLFRIVEMLTIRRNLRLRLLRFDHRPLSIWVTLTISSPPSSPQGGAVDCLLQPVSTSPVLL